MTTSLEPYREAGLRAVDYQLQFLQPDGGYIWEGYAPDAFHKQAYSWSIAGHMEEAHRLLTWVRDKKLGPDGQLEGYNGDVYKHAWFFHGAHRLGRFDLSYPVMRFLLSCQAPCGGFPHYAKDENLRSLATCWAGIAALHCGQLEDAQRAAQWAISVLHQQPDGGQFHFATTRTGELVTDGPSAEDLRIDPTKPKQAYWEVGLPLQLMCRLYMATGIRPYLDHARRFFELHFGFYEDRFSYVGSGKSSLGSALYYLLTGDTRGKDAALCYADFLVATQVPEGGWRDETEPDIPLIYIDHAAEFNIWLQELCAILPAADLRWGNGVDC